MAILEPNESLEQAHKRLTEYLAEYRPVDDEAEERLP